MIEVFGYLGAPGEGLRRALDGAGLVVGGARALAALGVRAERRVVLGRVRPAIETVAAYERAGAPDGPVVVLASGDPLLYGVARRFRAAGLCCQVHAGVSSVAAAFAAVGVPWDDAQVVSAHGHGLGPALAAARALPKVAVLTAPGQGVREIATGLADLNRRYVVAERLGEPEERVRVLDASAAVAVGDVAEPNVVLVLAAPPESPDVLGEPTPYVGGPRHARGAGQSPRGRWSPAVALVLGRHVPVLGDTVWTAGDLLPGVAAWCARTGAAVVDLAALPHLPTYLLDPDLILLDDPALLAACYRSHRPRVLALLSADADAEHAAGVVDALDLPDQATVTVEHLALTGEDGATRTTYLTTIELATGIDPTEEDA